MSHTQIELDVVTDEKMTIGKFVGNMLDKKIHANVKHWEGPGGGWPVVVLTGPADELLTVIKTDYFRGEEPDMTVEEMLEIFGTEEPPVFR